MVKKKTVIETIKKVFFNYIESEPESLPDIASANKLLCKAINELPEDDGWIPVEERLPEEHDSTLELYDYETGEETSRSCTESDDVLVTVEIDGEITTGCDHVLNGKWYFGESVHKVLAWKPYPTPYTPPVQPSKLPQSWIKRTMSEFERVE